MTYQKNYALIDWSKPISWEPKKRDAVARSSLPFPMFMSDEMNPVQSMLDGKYYTSKSALRATYKSAGCVEVGNDPARLKRREKPKPDGRALKAALEKAEARFNRGERVNKIAQA